jgi:hypothetical protein
VRALLLLLTACWSNSQPAATLPPPQPSEPAASSSNFRPHPPRNSCRTTVDRLADQIRPEMQKTGLPEATMDALAETTVESCLAMDWSPDLMQCFATIQDPSEMSTCQQLMSPEQSDDLQKRIMDVISKMGQLPPQPTPTP